MIERHHQPILDYRTFATTRRCGKKRNTIIQVNRTARTAMEVFRNVLDKDDLE